MVKITALETFDVRFPTSLAHDGSDAMNPDPDYSAAYVVLKTDAADGLAGYVSNLRRVGINAEFNGALCRGLLAARFDLDTPFVPKSKTQPASPGT